MIRVAALIAATLLTATSAGATPEIIGDQMATKHLVKLPTNRSMNMTCLGRGAPTVVFEQGAGSNILHWDKVAGAVSAITTACFYDRAGEGYSEPSGRPVTASNVVEDLAALLDAKGITGPIILVPHSIGGIYATLFADLYPQRVAGMVMIDPSFAGQFDWIKTDDQEIQDAIDFHHEVEHLTNCQSIAIVSPIKQNDPICFWAYMPGRTNVEKQYLHYASSGLSKYVAELSETQNFNYAPGGSVDEQEENKAKRSFGSMPLIVLTSGKSPQPPPGAPIKDLTGLVLSWKEGHDALAARSTRGKSVVVPDAGHFIQLDRPDVVIDAIRTVVTDVRADKEKEAP